MASFSPHPLSLSLSLSHIHIHAQPHCVSYHQQPSTAQRNTASINHTQTLLKCLVRLSSMDLFISVGTSLQTSQQLWTTHSVNRTRNTVSVSNVLSLVFISQLFGHITRHKAGNPRIVVQPINVMIHQFLYSNRMAIHTSGSECFPSSLVFRLQIRSVRKQLPNSILIGLLVCQNLDHLLTPYRRIRRLAPCWICTEPTTRKVIMLDSILRGSRRRPLFGSLSVIYALVGRDSAQNTIPGGSQRARFLKITH